MLSKRDPLPIIHYASPSPSGFTIIEVIGVLAVLATLLAILVPNIIDQLDRAVQEAEARNVRAIGQGVELYLTQNLDWPNNLNALAPEYVPFDKDMLKDNPRGYKRYLEIHKDGDDYKNDDGIAPGNLSDLRFMIISDLSQDAQPSISDGSDFDAYWDTDDSIVPDLLIYRGTLRPMMYLVSLSAVGNGGSFQIDGKKTNSFGNGSSTYEQYHLQGTLVELSEDNSFSGGGAVKIRFNLTADVGYQWDPNCSVGTKWHVLGAKC